MSADQQHAPGDLIPAAILRFGRVHAGPYLKGPLRTTDLVHGCVVGSQGFLADTHHPGGWDSSPSVSVRAGGGHVGHARTTANSRRARRSHVMDDLNALRRWAGHQRLSGDVSVGQRRAAQGGRHRFLSPPTASVGHRCRLSHRGSLTSHGVVGTHPMIRAWRHSWCELESTSVPAAV
jgi:hypothetical protein